MRQRLQALSAATSPDVAGEAASRAVLSRRSFSKDGSLAHRLDSFPPCPNWTAAHFLRHPPLFSDDQASDRRWLREAITVSRINSRITTVGCVRTPNSCAEDRCPKPWKTGKGKRPAFWARMSVEATVVILVAFAAVGIFAVKIFAGEWEDSNSPAPDKVVGLRHDAISETPPTDTAPAVANVQHISLRPRGASGVEGAEPYYATAATDQDKSSQSSALVPEPSNQTVVRNGITVLSPPLLVPVINDDAIQMANGSEVLASPHKAPSARKRSHSASRVHLRAQRRVVRSAPFWRVVDR